MKDFSVAMSVYKGDNSSFFDRALESITEFQTVKPSEICLVVDGPVCEDIDKVIDKYQNKYCSLKVIRLKENHGLGNALRIATESSKYDLIARMDSDDVAVSDRFEQQLRYFESNVSADIVGGNITEFIDFEDNVVASRVVPIENNEIRKYMKKRCAFNHMTVMFKKKSVLEAGGYQDWFYNEDYYLWIRMWLNGAVFANTGTILVNVRTGPNMYARRGGKKYFKSEKKLQKYMLDHDMINKWTYFCNCSKRFFVECLLPDFMRGWVFRNLARKK